MTFSLLAIYFSLTLTWGASGVVNLERVTLDPWVRVEAPCCIMGNTGLTIPGLIYTASRNGVELGEDSLWGIESDSDSGPNSYYKEVALDCAYQAIFRAKANLDKLCKGS